MNSYFYILTTLRHRTTHLASDGHYYKLNKSSNTINFTKFLSVRQQRDVSVTRCKRECQLRTRRTKSKTNQNSSYCDVSMRRCGGANKERAQKNKNNTFNILLRPLWEVHITPQKNILMPTFLKHPKTSQGYLSVGKQRNATEEQKQYFNILQRPLWSVHITSQNNIFMPTFSKHPKTSQGCLCSLGYYVICVSRSILRTNGKVFP